MIHFTIGGAEDLFSSIRILGESFSLRIIGKRKRRLYVSDPIVSDQPRRHIGPLDDVFRANFGYTLSKYISERKCCKDIREAKIERSCICLGLMIQLEI